jgi:hypothetical protein
VYHPEAQAAPGAHTSAMPTPDAHHADAGPFESDPAIESTATATDAVSPEPMTADEAAEQGSSTSSVSTDQGGLGMEMSEPQANAGGSQSGAAGGSVPLSPQQRLYYQNFLHDFFVTIGMPDIAACYASAEQTGSDGWSNPGNVGDSTEVVGVSDPSNEMK